MAELVLDAGKGMVGVNGKMLPGCFKYMGGAEVPHYRWKQFVEWSWGWSVTKFQSQCWILEPGFPSSVVMGTSKEGYVWVINDADDKMHVPEGTMMGIGQDWEEEEQEMSIVNPWVP